MPLIESRRWMLWIIGCALAGMAMAGEVVVPEHIRQLAVQSNEAYRGYLLAKSRREAQAAVLLTRYRLLQNRYELAIREAGLNPKDVEGSLRRQQAVAADGAPQPTGAVATYDFAPASGGGRINLDGELTPEAVGDLGGRVEHGGIGGRLDAGGVGGRLDNGGVGGKIEDGGVGGKTDLGH